MSDYSWKQLRLPLDLMENPPQWDYVGSTRPQLVDRTRKAGEAVNVVLDVSPLLASQRGWSIYEYRITKRTDKWLMILKARKRKLRVVAFIGGQNPRDCLAKAKAQILGNLVRWKPDKFAKPS